MDAEAVIGRMLGSRPCLEDRIGGGRNSRVYRIRVSESEQYAAKFYLSQAADRRDRIRTEFQSLSFLWENGVRCIPRPIQIDVKNQCAVYEFVPGEPITPESVWEGDIDQAAQFLIRLHELSRENRREFPPASEACFAIREIVDNIESRLRKLQSIPNETFCYDELQNFLSSQFRLALNEVSDWCRSELLKSGLTPEAVLEEDERTLSPSDFGYHNALRKSDGTIVFLDFEYFGQDDPAKMTCDFVLHPHPAMQVPGALKKRYVDHLLRHFGSSRLKNRVEWVYPLFGLKWCTILLNEFVPELYHRREFAGTEKSDKHRRLVEQFEKTQNLLNRIMKNYVAFPYFN